MSDNINRLAIESCIDTLNKLGMNIKETHATELPQNSVRIQIEFVGDVKGYIILETSTDMACKIANIMMQGMMEVNEFDDMAKSVLSEVCNMVSGNLSTSIANLGYTSDIKPPALAIVPQPLAPEKGTSLKYIADDGQVINAYFIRIA